MIVSAHCSAEKIVADSLFRSSNLNLSVSVPLTQQMPHILYSSALGLCLTAQRPEKPSNVSSGFTQLSASSLMDKLRLNINSSPPPEHRHAGAVRLSHSGLRPFWLSERCFKLLHIMLLPGW